MSIKKCIYCKTEIDKKASVCLNCKKSQGYSGKSILVFAIIFFGIILYLGVQKPKTSTNYNNTKKIYIENPSIELVSNSIKPQFIRELLLLKTDFEVVNNTFGKGTIVYIPKTNFYGVKRILIWIVLDNNIFALNGTTEGISKKNVIFPRENLDLWKNTNIDPYSGINDVKKFLNFDK